MTKTIKIHHVAKIEGHANLITDLERGKIKKARFRTMEGSRLIESILVGRDYQEAPLITARICGICPVVHNLGSIKAIEDAFGIKVSDKTIVLRKLMMMGQFIQSHSLHLYFLTLPDYWNFRNNIDLLKKHPDKSKIALAVREFGNMLIETIGGRSIHPMNSAVGGFLREPSKEKLKDLLNNCDDMLKQGAELAQVFLKLNYPKFSRKTEYVGLSSKDYAIYDGDLNSTMDKNITAEKFLNKVEEEISSYDLIKKTKLHGKIYMVGALSRMNLNRNKLRPLARQFLKNTKISFPSYNSFHNILCQMAEIIHCLEESKFLLKKYLDMKGSTAVKKYKIKAGKGIGVIEAPRGTLFHNYEIDQYGILKKVNIITPTAQFVNNLEKDMEELLPNSYHMSVLSSRKKMRMLVRAYDPCMTCATH